MQAGWQPQLPVYPQYNYGPQPGVGTFSPNQTYQWPQQAQEVDAVELFLQELGIQDYERVHFGWLAEYGLQEDALPPGWTSHTDSATGRIFFADTESNTTSWENPIADCLRRTIELGRIYLSAPAETFFEDQMELLWDQHKQELEGWHGPMTDNAGQHYFINSSTGVSSRKDPRANTQFFWEVERTVLQTFQENLVAPEPEGLPSFGLSDDNLLERLNSVEQYAFDQGDGVRPQTGGRRAGQQMMLDMARERTEQAGRVHREDLKCVYKEMIKSLNSIDFVVKDEAEAQRMIMSRKFRERRDQKRRKEQEEHERRFGQEWLQSLQAMEAASREAEARRKAEADMAEARRAELFRQQIEEQQRMEDERRREDGERKASEEERSRLLAEKAALLHAKVAGQVAHEDSQRKAEEARKAREDLIARIREAVHNKNAERLRSLMLEAEAAGLQQELEPLRRVLQQELAFRRTAALKARRAAEKLVADYASAKEAQDVGGPTLAAQWRAAVKEVAKPFDEEQSATTRPDSPDLLR